ncbi:fibronectin type III domain-containing protein [Paenibacillus terrae]|uniref:fibronectin type III domain-containing protein n=1 Tax=Paenibacillus terrae TaxID=159743 RepID=UPI0011EA9390|nr:fibronectin type III domain-containing protein [Paenibacillus terrae]
MRSNFMKTILLVILSFLMSMPVAMAANGETGTVKGMQGVSPTKGTIVTVSGTYSPNIGMNAIDRNLNTVWNAGDYKGTIQFVFPEKISLNFIQIAAYSNPKSNNYYTIYGLKNGNWTAITSKVTRYVEATVTITDPIEVTPGVYEGIKIVVDGGYSWAHINELTIGITNTTDNSIKDLKADAGDSQATLSWGAVENAESYTVKFGTESGKHTETATATKDAYGNFVIPGLTNGTKYYFVVSAKVNGVDSEYSNEASATPQGGGGQTDPGQPSGNHAILVVTMTTGLEKEFDLSMKEVNDFIAWYEGKQAGSGSASYAINKHDNNKGPFSNRKDYMLYDRILTFEVSEYSK